MTVTIETARNDYDGTGTTGPFPYSFRIMAATDLLLTRLAVDGTLTTLQWLVDYTVTDVGQRMGGTVTLVAALAVGEQLTIVRAPALLQLRSIENQGAQYPAVLQAALDYAIMVTQWLQDQIDRSLKLAIDNIPGAIDMNIVPLAGGYLRMTPDGLGWDMTSPVMDAGSYLGPGAGAVARTVSAKLSDFVSIKDFGAHGDGSTPDRFAFAQAIADGVTGLWIPTGSYPISASITFPATMALHFEGGASLKVANGVEVIIGGSIQAPDTKIFDLVGTGTVLFEKAATDYRWDRVRTEWVCPEWWGALGRAGGGDDTVAVQAAFDSHRPCRFNMDYLVTQVTISGNELLIDFRRFYLVAIATAAARSVLEIKCGYSRLFNIKVDVALRLNYETGVHWYTNNLNLYYPGKNNIDGLYIRHARVGLTIGALPSQGAIPAAGTVQPNGTATDAPVSESYIAGFATLGCPRGVFYRQPNGKLTFLAPELTGQVADWGGTYPTPAETCALTMAAASELAIVGGSLEQIEEATGKLAWIKDDAHLVVNGTVIEMLAPYCQQGDSQAFFSNILNGFGIQGVLYSMFLIDSAATGSLNFNGVRLIWPIQYLTSQPYPFAKSVTDFATQAFAPNYTFIIKCLNVNFRDTPWYASGAVFVPLVKGLRIQNLMGWLSSYNGGGRILSATVSDDNDKFVGAIDQPSTSITAYPQTANAASGSWDFVVNSVADAWGMVTAVAAAVPTIDQESVSAVVRLTSAVAGFVRATSPAVSVPPGGVIRTLRGWIKTGATTKVMKIQAFYYNWASGAVGSLDCFNGPQNQFGASWQPFIFRLAPPADCTLLKVRIEATDGADVQFLNVTLR